MIETTDSSRKDLTRQAYSVSIINTEINQLNLGPLCSYETFTLTHGGVY